MHNVKCSIFHDRYSKIPINLPFSLQVRIDEEININVVLYLEIFLDVYIYIYIFQKCHYHLSWCRNKIFSFWLTKSYLMKLQFPPENLADMIPSGLQFCMTVSSEVQSASSLPEAQSICLPCLGAPLHSSQMSATGICRLCN